MTRTKKSKPGVKRRAEEAAAKKVAAAAGPSQPVDVAGLLDKAHVLLAQSNFDLAIKFLARALEHEPGNLEAREVLGVAELEGGDEETGREHLLRLFPPHTSSPPTHPSPYLYLAQTAADPQEALGYYSTAASIIENSLQGGKGKGVAGAEDDEDERREMVAMGVRAVLAMIEIWMSDLCMESEAEANCDSLIARALSIAPEDAEVQLTLASIRMSQSRFDEAKSVVHAIYEKLRDADAFDPTLPSLPIRLALARQLLEHSLHLPAIEILQTAREEDSLEVESAYLEGWAFYLRAKALDEGLASTLTGANGAAKQSAEAAENGAGVEGEEEEKTLEDLSAAECLAEGMRALIECAALFAEQNYPDEGIGSHVAELLDELKGKGVVPALAEDGEGEGGADGEWEDVEMA